MDTATHFAMGAALAGVATIDPAAIQYYPAFATAVVVGSQIPDIDTVLKIKNNAVYITHHRGITHSLPFTLLWAVLLTIIISFFNPGIDMLHLYLWTQLAVGLHVFVDIFNSYGTQALRPFSNRWIQIGIINTFDPIIFGLLIVGCVLWPLTHQPFIVFMTILVILIVYYIIRRLLQQSIRKRAIALINPHETIKKTFVAPTIKFFEWRVALQTDQYDYIGRSYGTTVNIIDKLQTTEMPNENQLKYALQDSNLKAFLSFSSIYRWTFVPKPYGHELRVIDLRYLKDGHYTFVAILKLDHDYKVTHSYTGWVFSEEKLQKVLGNNSMT